MFNPTVVAARALATNISLHVNTFSNNFNVGMYPPIIKAWAEGDRKGMYSILFNGSKITFFLNWIFALPLYLNIEFVLHMWLGNAPQYAAIFTKLALVEVLLLAVSLPLTTAARAPGKMRTYEITLGMIQLLILPASWWLLQLGSGPEHIYFVAICATFLMFAFRLWILKYLIHFPIKEYLKQVVVPLLLVAISSMVCAILILYFQNGTVIHFLLGVTATIISSILLMYFVGLDRETKLRINEIILKKIVLIRS
jgi:O-antigen/teichoic acid export membrane protein